MKGSFIYKYCIDVRQLESCCVRLCTNTIIFFVIYLYAQVMVYPSELIKRYQLA